MPDRFDPDHRRAPGSETWNEMSRRVGRGLDTVIERHPGETIVVVSHGGVIIQALARWIGLDLASDAASAWFDPANTSLTECRLGSSPYSPRSASLQLVRYNDHAHLSGSSLNGKKTLEAGVHPEERLAAVRAKGGSQKFVLFWGHRRERDGRPGAGCFSQWWPADVVVDSITYPTAEHWMMAEKARLFNDADGGGESSSRP
jgi:hypothetical protein